MNGDRQRETGLIDGHDPHRRRMDAIYRRQRHIYDVTRRFILPGRDRLIRDLAVPDGGSVLEIGCGTARNLGMAARLFPAAKLYGIDLSDEMLRTARRKIGTSSITLAQADATAFDPAALFGTPLFDRVFLSYALSMIPGWREALSNALGCVAPGGRLSVVDFGQLEGWTPVVRAALFSWLARFTVEPRADLEDVMRELAEADAATLTFTRPLRGYAQYGIITKT